MITVIFTSGIQEGVKVTLAEPVGVTVIFAVEGEVAVLFQVNEPLPLTEPELVVTPFHNTVMTAVPVIL